MYDEFERAVTGRSRQGLSFLGWLSIAVGTLFVLGIVGAGLAFVRVKSEVEEIAHEIRRELEVSPTVATDAVVERLESHATLLSVSPDEGVSLLQNVSPESPGDAFMEEFFGGTLNLFPEAPEIASGIRDQVRDGLVEIGSGGERLRMDLVRGDEGGSLVIQSDEGQVRLDLRKTADGGYLAIDSEEGEVRFDLVERENGGALIVNSREGEVRFEVEGGDDGGTMVVRTDDTTLRFGAGEEAQAMPGWVRRVEGMPEGPRKVYSLSSERGFMGAVAWQGDGSARDILTFYRDWLEGEGYELRAQHRTREGRSEVSSLWARHQERGRVVFLVVGQERGHTEVLLGYGQEG